MVSIISLWLPILLSAVAVFLLSSIIHMVLPYHKSDFKKLPDEDQVMENLGKFKISQGEYMFPYSTETKERNSQEFKDKMNKGPIGILTVFPSGTFGMGSSLAMWFIYCLIVGIFAAYIAGRALQPGVVYLSVFRFVGAAAFIGYSLALIQDSIWYRRSWSNTFKSIFDGLIYALFTAGIFGWLWPAA
jgi:hypothetical protein